MKTRMTMQMVTEMHETENSLIEKMPDNIEANKVYLTNDLVFLRKRIDELFNMLKTAYEDKGGLIVKDTIDLLKNKD